MERNLRNCLKSRSTNYYAPHIPSTKCPLLDMYIINTMYKTVVAFNVLSLKAVFQALSENCLCSEVQQIISRVSLSRHTFQAQGAERLY